MRKDILNQQSVKKESVAESQTKVYAVPADYLDIREEDFLGAKKSEKTYPLSTTPAGKSAGGFEKVVSQ